MVRAEVRKGEMMDDMVTLILIVLLVIATAVIVTAVGLYTLIDITSDMSRKIDKWKKYEEERRKMSGWGIADTAPKIEKIKAESADYLHGLDSCGKIEWSTYSDMFDFYEDLIEKAYAQGKEDAQPEIKADGDVISRHQTIDALMQEFKRIPTNSIRAKLVVENLPSAQPETNCSEIPNNSDLISRQAAIDALFELYEYQRDIDPTEAADLVRQGIYLAEKKIEQLPSAQPEPKTGWDAISRPAAIEEVCNMMRECFEADDEILDALKTTLNELTAIYPERKTGRWIKPTGMMPPEHHGHYECSECGAWAMRPWLRPWKGVVLTDFCPNCGSPMLKDGENIDS